MILILSFLCIICPLPVSAQWEARAEKRLAEIDKHISDTRTQNVVISITKDGKAAAGVETEMKMLRHEFLFGGGLVVPESIQNNKNWLGEQGLRYFADIFNFATLNVFWKNHAWSREKKDWNSDWLNKNAEWCQENGITCKGHTFCVRGISPLYLNSMSIEDAFQAQLRYAAGMSAAYAGRIDYWDAINEFTQHGVEKNKIGEVLTQFTHEEVAKQVCAAVHKANPKAKCIINDYRTQEDFTAFLDKLRDKKGKPVFDIVGIQLHMHGGEWSSGGILHAVEAHSRLKLPVHITELTLKSRYPKGGPPPTPETEKRQAEEVIRVYKLLFSLPAVEAITWWDFKDPGWYNEPAGLLREDGSPKPAYNTLKKLIKEQWWTNVTKKTDSSGKVKVRAFRGEYQITATLPDGTKKEFLQTVKKGTNKIELKM